jgi:hypothetical protein
MRCGGGDLQAKESHRSHEELTRVVGDFPIIVKCESAENFSKE